MPTLALVQEVFEARDRVEIRKHRAVPASISRRHSVFLAWRTLGWPRLWLYRRGWYSRDPQLRLTEISCAWPKNLADLTPGGVFHDFVA